jgi:hypothetical protein
MAIIWLGRYHLATSRGYSATRVSGRLNGVREYDEMANGKEQIILVS